MSRKSKGKGKERAQDSNTDEDDEDGDGSATPSWDSPDGAACTWAIINLSWSGPCLAVRSLQFCGAGRLQWLVIIIIWLLIDMT